MRRTLLLLCLIAGIAAAPSRVCAQSTEPASENFVNAFLDFRKGEEQEKGGNFREAMKSYREAADLLAMVKQKWPSWQPGIVEFRLKRINEAITHLQEVMAKQGISEGPGSSVPPRAVPVESPGTARTASSEEVLGTDTLLPPVLPDAARSPDPAPAPPKRPKSADADRDPIGEIQARIKLLTEQLQETKDGLQSEQKKNATLTAQLAEIAAARAKAEAERKKAQELAEIYQERLITIKGASDKSSDKTKALEADLAGANKKLATAQADLAAADERTAQLTERTKALAAKAQAAAAIQVKLEESSREIETARKEKIILTEKITKVTKERDTATAEVARLKDLNKERDKLAADNTDLLKKMGDLEKQILNFKTETPKKDEEILSLKKQVADAQKSFTVSQEKNTALQTEITELQAKVGDYSKQIQQAKADKTATVEERKKMEDENKLLQGIVRRVMQEDANRKQREIMVQKELEKINGKSETLTRQLGLLAEPVVKLTAAERSLFKVPIQLNVEDPNMLIAVLPAANPAINPTNPAAPVLAKTDNPPGETPQPTPGGPVASTGAPTAPPTDPLQLPKLDTPPGTPVPPGPGGEPTTGKEPEKPNGAGPTVQTTVSSSLPEALKPLAEQAKQAFEREKYPEAVKVYEKALAEAPNNLYLLSNLGVTQFRAGQLKSAESTFKKAIAIAPEDAFAHCTLGIVQYSQQKFDEAVNSLTKSLAINAKNPTAHNYLGITAAQKGWMEAAQKEVETSLQLDPKYADAWFNLAVILATKQPPNKEEARKAYARAVELGAEPDRSLEQLLK